MLPNIKVIGVGGSGSNTISRMAHYDMAGVELIAVNTDAQALQTCRAPKKLLIGRETTRGLGAGMDMAVGRKAAEENIREIREMMAGADMLFITCGLGGGTGSGASSVIARAAQQAGILTVAAVTMPFSFEGAQRRQIAQAAQKNLKAAVDSLLVISNDKLLGMIDEKTTVSNAFEMCDDILRQAVASITDLILSSGIITVDFASVVSILHKAGQTLFGTGRSSGADRASEAARRAINSPLLDFSMRGARGILFNVSGNDTTLNEIKLAGNIITEHADPKAKIVFGAVKDHDLKKGEIKITVIATKV